MAEALLSWDQRRVIELTGKVPLKKGRQVFEIGLAPKTRPLAGEEELFLKVQRVIVQGPLGGEQLEYAKGYRMIFVDGPAPEGDSGREKYARKIMRSFVSRAFRKPLDEQTIDRLIAIVREISNEPGKTFQDGIKRAIATCLASPRLLFRVEIQPEPNNPENFAHSTGKLKLLIYHEGKPDSEHHEHDHTYHKGNESRSVVIYQHTNSQLL